MAGKNQPKTGGRKKGSKNLDGYKMSPAAVEQRRQQMYKLNGKSFIIEQAITDSKLSKEQKDSIRLERLDMWKKLSSPVLLLTDQYAEIKTLIDIKRLEDGEYLGKDILSATKILLDISKEINRLTQVSADKKIDLISKNFNADDDLTFDVEP